MKKKVLITIIAIISSELAFAYNMNLSYSKAYFLIYSWSVLPLILWIANLIFLVKTVLKKSVSNGLFWFVNCFSIALALILIYPVYRDISEFGYKKFENYGLTLISLIITPLIISIIAIRVRRKGLKRNPF
ncbi:hypothetical protein [Owenweeksia hongkongensis]|uniref:hypothetical protein n=1 Tax=Owenweeksia hongkongensis TaxID=253245 RepID=UPI003A957CC2